MIVEDKRFVETGTPPLKVLGSMTPLYRCYVLGFLRLSSSPSGHGLLFLKLDKLKKIEDTSRDSIAYRAASQHCHCR